MNTYTQYLRVWFEGLYSEVEYWDKLLNLELPESCRISEASNPLKKFELEDELPYNPEQEYKFVDVGSGAFSRCGFLTDKVILKIKAVDPLANVYKYLKKLHGVENGLNLETGFVELLSNIYEENSFDMVHMSNSLDHSFDAIYGIYQLIWICKVGGKIILRHAENVAKDAAYSGLHQWNLSLINEENSFVVWNKEERYDICKIFGDYVDFELFPNMIEPNTGWKYNKVVMKKKKNIVLPSNDYYSTMFHSTYAYLIETIMKNVFMNIGDSTKVTNQIILKRMAAVDVSYLNQKFAHEKIIVYGLGEVGKKFIDLLCNNNIPVYGTIDKKGVKYKEIRSLHIEESERDKTVIVTLVKQYDEVRELLEKLGWQNVLCIEDYF